MEPQAFSRRAALKASTAGFGYLAFAGMAAGAEKLANPLAPKPTHFPAKAKRIVFLCMEGAPSHIDTFDPKPRLTKEDGQAFRGRGQKIFASPFKFTKHGDSGMPISELFPNLAKHADKLCILNGLHTDVPSHPQAFLQMHTGSFQFKRPSMGAWTVYGLGTANDNLPGFVTIAPPLGLGGPSNYGASFLPAVYQGTPVGQFRRPVSQATVNNIKNENQSDKAQRMQLDFIQGMNRELLQQDPVNAAIDGTIASFELAFRMQKDLPKLLDLTNETQATQKLYGIGSNQTDDFGRQCLLARRFLEAGVRFVEVCSAGWDHHTQIQTNLTRTCGGIDLPIAGLITDLHKRGMLEDTLILWGGEFGRTPYSQAGDGRDHNSKGYTMWMAGGGVKGGHIHGKTDEYGYEAIEGKMHIADLHATVLHLLGMDHEKLTFRYAGRDVRLTDVKGVVAKEIVKA